MALTANPGCEVAGHFDVAIVGGRCAGAPLAALLARAGMRVVLIEQTTFPRDTLSSHFTQSDALAFLDRLGVLDRVRASGAPFISHVDMRFEDVGLVAKWPEHPGDVGGAVCVRRHILDPILAGAATAAGVDVRMGCKVIDLLRKDGRVIGVRVVRAGREGELRAPLVVGADGRFSLVARLTGARSYHVIDNERSYYWGYFEDYDAGHDPTFYFHRWENRLVWAVPADSGLFLAGMSPELAQLDEFGRDRQTAYLEQIQSCAPVADVLAGARRVGRLHGIRRFTGYFRDACGPGWVLVGDAGHFKDPAVGRGIGDAFVQVERLVPAIVEGLGAGTGELDRALAGWARWRDREFLEHYWMAADLGCAGALATPAPQIIRRIAADGRRGTFLDLLSHRSRPSKVLGPGRAVVPTMRLLARSGTDRRALIGEVGGLLASETRRRWRRRRPAYEAPGKPMTITAAGRRRKTKAVSAHAYGDPR